MLLLILLSLRILILVLLSLHLLLSTICLLQHFLRRKSTSTASATTGDLALLDLWLNSLWQDTSLPTVVRHRHRLTNAEVRIRSERGSSNAG